MKNMFGKILLFGAGATAGSLVTWKLVKTKYERIAQEEIDSVKEVFSRNRENTNETTTGESEDEDDGGYPKEHADEDPQEHAQRVYEYEAKLRQLKYSSVKSEEEGGGEPVINAPYVILPEKFGEDGFESTWLTYYSDGVLEDDYYNVITNVDDVVGADFVNHFGEYADDTVFIRNEGLNTDYEITKDKRTYAESLQYSPHKVNQDA